jgi:hypothetical protein
MMMNGRSIQSPLTLLRVEVAQNKEEVLVSHPAVRNGTFRQTLSDCDT